MAENKTRPTGLSVDRFLKAVPDGAVRKDCQALIKMMRATTRKEPVMWGSSIVGFGQVHYKYASGREGDMPLIGFSPRKQNLTLYLVPGFDAYGELLGKLGRFTTGKGCLYIKRLDDVHLPTLKKLIRESVKHTAELFPA
jgi:hypothetical protein